MTRLTSLLLGAALTLAVPAFAQTETPARAPGGDPPSKQSLEAKGACSKASVSEAATAPAPASADGTAPGSSGSTGWSGGTGGSFIGTSAAGALPDSKTWQPPTARGLDLAGRSDTPANC
jgi:hypothetical protein